MFFFFKQKTAYEMRISDWSSDVCSSDLLEGFRRRNPRGFSALYMQRPTPQDGDFFKSDMVLPYKRADLPPRLRIYAASDHAVARKSALQGKSVSVSVATGGRRIINTKHSSRSWTKS